MDTYLKICFLGPIHDWNWIGYGWRMVSLMSWCEGCVTKIHQSCVWKKSNFAIFGRLLLSYIEYVWNVAPKIKSLILSSFGAKIQTVNFLHSLNPDDVHFWWLFMLLRKFFKFLNIFWFCLQYGRERILSLGLLITVFNPNDILQIRGDEQWTGQNIDKKFSKLALPSSSCPLNSLQMHSLTFLIFLLIKIFILVLFSSG